ncbi:MAG: 3-deoxy-D-manno-octulosonic acid transferase [Opitutales bacterium]
MIWLYRLLFPFVALLAAPHYVRRMLKRGGYGEDWQQRFGFAPELPEPEEGVKRYWIQAVSVGEINAIAGLLDELEDESACEFVITTTTSTGYARLKERYGQRARAIGYFPLDWWPCSAAAWRRLRPSVVVLMESELWPEHLTQAWRRGVPVALVNGRLSERSAARYALVGWLARRLFGRLSLACAASAADAERLRCFARELEVHEPGSLKADVDVGPELSREGRMQLRAELGFRKSAFVLAGLSTWPGEEAWLAALQDDLRKHSETEVELLLIPRHAERRNEIVAALAPFGRAVHLRSHGPNSTATDHIYLADTTGEMVELMQAANMVFIGKSLPPHTEGQTPLEAAALGIPMAFGPSLSNFRSLCESLLEAGGARRIHNAKEMRLLAAEWITHPERAAETGQRAREWHAAQRGAARKTAQLLRQVAASKS